ncbi:MAG: hypothetical protein R2748_15035 [Bryobacterales bacterium]
MQHLDGTVSLNVTDLEPAIAQLDAFLGKAEGESVAPTSLAGPLTATVNLGGTLDNPAIRMQARGDNLTAGEVRNVLFTLDGAYANSTLTLDDLALAWNRQRAELRGTVGVERASRRRLI